MTPTAALAAGAALVVAPAAVLRALDTAGIDIPERAVAAYIAAADTAPCPVPWTILAAVGHRETDHGRYGGRHLDADGKMTPPVTNTAGASGPMQFIPSTWARYGRDGDGDGLVDVQDIDDAAAGAAAYLCALGVVEDPAAALNTYNSGDPTGVRGGAETRAYTPAVLAYAQALDDAVADIAHHTTVAAAERSVLAAADRALVAAWEHAGSVACGPGTPTVCGAWQNADRAAFGVENAERPAAAGLAAGARWALPLAAIPERDLTRPHHTYPAWDAAVETGTPTYAVTAGTVATVDDARCGLGVVLQTGPYRFIYCHLGNVDVTTGQQVTVGQRLGLTGNTGNSTGPHLHFGITADGETLCPQPTLLAWHQGRQTEPIRQTTGCTY